MPAREQRFMWGSVCFNEDEQITSDDEIQKWVKQIAK